MMNIASIMAKVIPGTFAPDMSAAALGAAEKPTISRIPDYTGGVTDNALTGEPIGSAAAGTASGTGHGDGIGGVGSVGATAPGGLSFKDTVKQMLGDVNDKLTTADQNSRDLATGKTNDLNRVVTSVEEANLAFQYTMAIRTKLLEAYTQVNQMAV